MYVQCEFIVIKKLLWCIIFSFLFLLMYAYRMCGTIFIQFHMISACVRFSHVCKVLAIESEQRRHSICRELSEQLLHNSEISPIGKNYAFKSKLLITLMLTQPICLLNRFNLFIQSESLSTHTHTHSVAFLSHCCRMIACACNTNILSSTLLHFFILAFSWMRA